MLLIPPPKYRRQREAVQVPVVTAPPLVLVSSYYDDTVLELFLTFDRAIDASGLVGTAVQVVDGNINGQTYLGTGDAVVLDGVTLRIQLSAVGDASGPDVVLNVAGGNGIVAGDDGSAWAGVSGVVLPFGENLLSTESRRGLQRKTRKLRRSR